MRIIERVVIARYADGFMKYAQHAIGQERALADIQTLRDTMRENPEFLKLLEHPQIPFHEKCDVIDRVLAAQVSEESRNFLKLLTDKRRIKHFPDIAEYVRVTYANEGEREVIIRTAFMQETETIRDIQSVLEKALKQKMKFYIDLDSNLVGGIQVVVGNTVLDGSVRGRLDELRDQLRRARA